mgnify:FL=1|jgi:hypothetical protein|tara:strand:- start:445 stop:951 length:507 start_codon:yes stop_codon:yes gene_type:complete
MTTEVKENVVKEEDVRASRSSDTRAKDDRPKVWKMPSALELPDEAIELAESQGLTYRWIRESILGQDDKTNVSKRFREGFEPVRPDELPGFHDLPTVDDGRHAGVIGVGGLILCKIDKNIADQRNDFFEQQTQNQMTAVENDLMREENPSMPISSKMSSKVTFGGSGK